jgi:hypothetical protein
MSSRMTTMTSSTIKIPSIGLHTCMDDSAKLVMLMLAKILSNHRRTAEKMPGHHLSQFGSDSCHARNSIRSLSSLA